MLHILGLAHVTTHRHCFAAMRMDVGAHRLDNWGTVKKTTLLEEESGGRLSFRQIDGSAQLDIFGVTNPEKLTVAEFQAMMEAADPNRRITYRAAGGSWFVLSGYLDDELEPTIFYAKFMLNTRGTALSAFEISYPEADKAEFNPLVERLEESLTSPR